MTKNRLEAFSDGVIAIIITIMVLELHAPRGVSFEDLKPLLPKFLSYAMSFTFVGIYWNNHHHMLQLVEKVNGTILWANMHLLFWLSLVPFTTAWIGESHAETAPTMLYGLNLLMCAIAYTILSVTIMRHHGPESRLKQAVGRDAKGKLSMACYIAALVLAFVEPRVSIALYVFVSLVWLVPDRRIERVL